MSNLIAEVNSKDKIIGFSDKESIHAKGLLHRAFSIFIFNSKGNLLLQQRSLGKYHTPGLWTNTCCSHLPKDMEMEKAACLRLKEEMGFNAELKHIKTFHYRVQFENGLIENEIDHIYVGFYNQEPKPNPSEVAKYKWVDLPTIEKEIELHPEEFTYWFKHIIKHYYQELIAASKMLIE